MSSNSSALWESWQSPGDYAAHKGQTVEVRRVGEACVLIRGKVCIMTDLVGGPAILEYGNYGADCSGKSVVAALDAPPSPPSCVAPPKKSHYQSGQRDFLNAAMPDQIAFLQKSITRAVQEWEQTFSNWLQQYEFRVIDSSENNEPETPLLV